MSVDQSNSSRLRKLNPAFAAAHGISLTTSQKTEDSAHVSQQDGTNSFRSCQLEKALAAAKATGKLNVSNAQLSAPLPDFLFDLRSAIKVDLSMDSTSPSSWEVHTEENLTVVDLSENPVGGSLDNRFERYLSLVTLRARRCQLDEIPLSVFSALQQLRTLDLRGNELTTLSFISLPNTIRELDVSSNKITQLIEPTSRNGVFRLPNLTKLDVSENCLVEMPDQLRFDALREFRFGSNKIARIAPSFISNISSTLTILEGPHNRMATVPSFEQCSQLRILDLSCNRLTKAPGVPTTLVSLLLSSNQIITLDGMFSGSPSFFSDITVLLLMDNRLTALNDQIVRGLIKLKVLDVGNNNINDLSPVLGYLPHVRQVNLIGNPLRRLRTLACSDTVQLLAGLRQRCLSPPEGAAYLPREDVQDAPQNLSTKKTARTTKDIHVSSSVLRGELQNEIDILANQLNTAQLTDVKKYALKKTLAVKKAKLIREERRIAKEAA